MIWWLAILVVVGLLSSIGFKIMQGWQMMLDSVDDDGRPEVERLVRTGALLGAAILTLGFLLGVASAHAAHVGRAW